MEDEKFHEVIKLCDKALKINKDLPEAYNLRANAKYELMRYNNAIDDFSLAINKERNNDRYYYNRGQAYQNLNKRIFRIFF